MRLRSAAEIMEAFREIGKSYTVNGLRNLINKGYLSADPVCTTTIFKWLNGTVPRGERMLAVMRFTTDHASPAKINSVPKTKSKRQKQTNKTR